MFEAYDFDSIMESMLEEVNDDFDKREGSVIYDALAPAAMRLYEFYIALGMVLNEIFADTASYYYLIKRAAERGLLPREASAAIGKMVVSPASAQIAIGDRFNLGDLNYAVTSMIDVSVGIYQITCESEGAAANQQLGELLPIETANELNDLEKAELKEILIPGENEEDVEAFRERYFNSFGNEAFGGNKADYIEKVNDLDGIGGCKASRRWNGGFHPASMVPTETVTNWLDSEKENLPDEVKTWLTAVYTAASGKLLTVGGTVEIVIINSEFKQPTQALIESVQETLDPEQNAGEGEGIAPIGHVVHVRGVKNELVDIDVSGIEYKPGYSFSNMKSTIENVIDAYFSELCGSWAATNNIIIRVSQVEARILELAESIADISGTLLDGKGENLLLPSDAIPVRGDVVG